MFTFKRMALSEYDEKFLQNFKDTTIYTTPQWFNFLEETQNNLEPVILKIYENNRFIGIFTGCIVRKFGIKLLGSPLKGWNTPFMGFDLIDNSQRYYILKELKNYAFRELKCVYIEITDRFFTAFDLQDNNIKFMQSSGFELNLKKLTLDEIYSGFTKGTKANIKKFTRIGCTIEEDYSDSFIEEYWDQLIDVFKSQGLSPSYDKDRIMTLIENLKSTNRILCIKALTPERKCIASLIQIGFNNLSVTFGVPSYLDYQKEFRPNEALMWYAIQWWKNRDVEVFDFGGGGEYKKKYGGSRIKYYTICYSRIPLAMDIRKIALKVYWMLKRYKNKLSTNNDK